MTHHELQLPFSGFEGTWYDTMIDVALDTLAESRDDDEDEDGNDLRSDLFENCDFQAVFHSLSKSFVHETNRVVRSLGIELDVQFAELEVPEEYNTRNDRIFGTIGHGAFMRLFAISAGDDHAVLRQLVHDECSDDVGYLSHYSPDLDTWLAKPLERWDFWETTLLVRAALAVKGLEWDDIEDQVQAEFEIADTVYNAVESAIDWSELDG